jgi:uncharacterized membrane protein
MTRRNHRDARAQLVGMLAIAAIGTAAYWIGEGASGGLQAAAILFGFVLVLHVGRRRSATLETFSGIGDERTRSLAQRSSSFTSYAMAFVLAGWGLVAAATGHYNTTIGVLSVVYAVTFLGACGVFSRRG